MFYKPGKAILFFFFHFTINELHLKLKPQLIKTFMFNSK